MIPFWGNFHTVRLNTPSDPRWYDTPIARLMKTGIWEYNEAKHHCSLQHITDGRTSQAFTHHVLATGARLFHIHYAFGEKGVKFRDNRRGDLGDPDKLDAKEETPDFNMKETGNWGEIRTATYPGPWPEVLQEYINGN